MNSIRRRPASALSASLLCHAAILCALALAVRHRPSAPYPLHLPGTPGGRHMLLTYSLGGPSETRQETAVHHPPPKATPRPAAPTATQPNLRAALQPPFPPPAEAGFGTSGDSAHGDENVRVALPQVHPRPRPDLSTLPQGTAGDVVVDVLIDDTGKVTAATLIKGLGATVDSTVLKALRDWTFTPATRNGQNIASEQEILIHYERG